MSFYTFMPTLLNMSLTASVAIVLVTLLRLLLKKAPKVISYALWGVVLFRLLCPVSIGSDFSVYIDKLDIRGYTTNGELDIRDGGGKTMPRPKFQTLTEQMFYILLCLKDECYGIDIFDKISALTGDQVTVGSGTLYNLLEQFLEAGMIREVKVEGRRRSYILTDKGREMLDNETQKLRKRVADYDTLFGKGDDQ